MTAEIKCKCTTCADLLSMLMPDTGCYSPGTIYHITLGKMLCRYCYDHTVMSAPSWDTPLERTIEEMKEDIERINQLLDTASLMHAELRSLDAQIIGILSLGCPF